MTDYEITFVAEFTKRVSSDDGPEILFYESPDVHTMDSDDMIDILESADIKHIKNLETNEIVS